MNVLRGVRVSATPISGVGRRDGSQKSVRFVRLSSLRELRDCEQVAAVCYRMRNQEIEFLLVRTRGSGRWTFPKGSTEPGLTHAQAAALEAFEEAGVHGRIEEAAFTRYGAGKAIHSSARPARKAGSVNAHLCEVLRLSPPKEADRDRTWFSPSEAKHRLRKDRDATEATEFARVVDKAVARIRRAGERKHGAAEANEASSKGEVPTLRSSPKDALRAIRFEAAPWTWEHSLERIPMRRTAATSRSSSLALTRPAKQLSGVIQMNPSAMRHSNQSFSGSRAQERKAGPAEERFKKA